MVMAKQHNHSIIRRIIADHNFAKSLVNEKGTFDLYSRKAGIKENRPYIDLTPKHTPLTLEDYKGMLNDSISIFERDQELGDLFLFKFILRARIDLYQAGEKRSARKQLGEAVSLTAELTRVKEHLDYLVRRFPFGTISDRLHLKEKIEIASVWLGKKNNTAANATLTPLTDRLETVIQGQVRERLENIRAARDPYKLKLRYNKGSWRLRQEGYKKTVVSLLAKEDIDHGVPTAKLLSKIQHHIDGIIEEIVRNERFIAELAYVAADPQGNWDRLFELHLTFTNYFDRHKEKACAEIEGALQLAVIGTNQSVALAKGLLNLAINDIGLRQDNLVAQKDRLACFYRHAEGRISNITVRFAKQIVSDLSQPAIFSGEMGMDNVDKRLGGFLGSLFKGEMREGWLKRAKSRVVGAKYALSSIKDMIKQKNEAIAEILERRETYLERREEYADHGGDLESFRENQLNRVRGILVNIAEINMGISIALGNAAKHILRMELDHANRNERVVEESEFFKTYQTLLHRFNLLNVDQVAVLGSSGERLGVALRGEAEKMGLKFKELP